MIVIGPVLGDFVGVEGVVLMWVWRRSVGEFLGDRAKVYGAALAVVA